MENIYNKKYNPIVETMNNNYLSKFENYKVDSQQTSPSNQEENKVTSEQNQPTNQNPLMTLLNNPMLNNGNYNDIIKNFSGNKNEMLMNLISTMNKNKTPQNAKSTTLDFSNLTSIDDYDFID